MKSVRRTTRASRRRAPVLPIVGSLLVAGGITLSMVVTHANARADELMRRLGARILTFPGAPSEPLRTLVVNGIELSLRTTVVDEPLARVLDHYDAVCASTNDGRPLGALVPSLAARSGRGRDDGYVACVAMGPIGLRELLTRAHRLTRSWDLSELGQPRYIYARRADEEPRSRTFVLTMHATGSLNLRSFLPGDTHDAAGVDPSALPRLPDTRRFLSVHEVSKKGSLFLYFADGRSPNEAVALYRSSLLTRQWVAVESAPGSSLEIDGIRMFSARRDGRLVTVLAYADDEGRTVLGVLAWGVT